MLLNLTQPKVTIYTLGSALVTKKLYKDFKTSRQPI